MIKLLIRTVQRWIRNDGMGLAAAVSFYSIFAMAPLGFLAVAISSRFLGKSDHEAFSRQLSELFPDTDTEPLADAIRSSADASIHGGLSITSAVLLVWAASVFCTRLQVCVRKIFEHEADDWKTALRRTVLGRFYSLALTFGAGLILAFGSVASSLALPFHRIAELGHSLRLEIPFNLLLTGGGILLICLSLPRRPPLKALLISGLLFLVIMSLGRLLVTQYLLHSPISTAYGIASSIVVILIWIFYATNFYGICVALCAELAPRQPVRDRTIEEEPRPTVRIAPE